MAGGSVRLGEVKEEYVEVICEKCRRYWKFSTDSLLDEFPIDYPLPALKGDITHCPGHGSVRNPCQAYFRKRNSTSGQ